MKTKKQKLADCHTVYEAAKAGVKPNRHQAKDGSIPTHPVVPVLDLSEAEVLKWCLRWLKARRIFHDRHDCGSGPGHARYGIKGAGDIIGILPCNPDRRSGQHFEIETKAGKGGRLSAGQQKRMADVRAAGGLYFVVHGVEELVHYMGDLV